MSTPISLSTMSVQVNTETTNAFKQIVTAGWANKSDGNVEANTGHFALVTIEPNELPELIDAVFDGDFAPVERGNFLFIEDNYGNGQLTEYATKAAAEAAYRLLEAEYAEWDGQGAAL